MAGVLSLKGVHDMCTTTCEGSLSLKGICGRHTLFNRGPW